MSETNAEKAYKIYIRLITAILNEFPNGILDEQVKAYNTFSGEDSYITLDQIKKEASKYILLAQSGRCFPILKKSPLGRYIYQGKWKQTDE